MLNHTQYFLLRDSSMYFVRIPANYYWDSGDWSPPKEAPGVITYKNSSHFIRCQSAQSSQSTQSNTILENILQYKRNLNWSFFHILKEPTKYNWQNTICLQQNHFYTIKKIIPCPPIPNWSWPSKGSFLQIYFLWFGKFSADYINLLWGWFSLKLN